MGAPDKWFLNPYIQAAFPPSGGVASRVKPTQPDTTMQSSPSGGSRYTGVGADGVYQPSAVTGQVHEKEWVLSAPVTQAIGADTLQALKVAAESGALTSDKLNVIRQAVGLPGQQGFEAGTNMLNFTRNIGGSIADAAANTTSGLANAQMAIKRAAIDNSNSGQGLQGANASSYGSGIAQRPYSLQRDAYGADRSGVDTVQPPPYQREDREIGQYVAGAIDPAAAKKAAMAASNAGTGTQYGTGIAKQPVTGAGTGTGTGADRSTFYRNLGMGGLADMARGQSPYFQAIQDMQQRRLAGQGAASEEALRQEMAQGGVGGGVARAALGEQARDIGSQMAEARAKTSAEQMRLAQEATGTLASQALAGKSEERVARGEQYGVMMNQYDQAIKSGQFPQAEQIWNAINAQFPEYATGVKPDFTKLGKTYNREQIDTLNTKLGQMISTGSSLNQVRGYITDKLESESGMTIENLAAQEGKTVDELVQETYDRVKEQGADDVTRLINAYHKDFADMVDTPEEAAAVDTWVKDMYYSGNLTIDATGNLTIEPDSALLPWKNPDTAHVFDAAYSVDPHSVAESLGVPDDDPRVQSEITRRNGIRTARTDYIESLPENTQPMPWEDWEGAYNTALSIIADNMTNPAADFVVDGKKYGSSSEFLVAYMDNATRAEKAKGMGGGEPEFTVGGHSVYSPSPGKYQYQNTKGEIVNYDFSTYRQDSAGNFDPSVVSNMALGGDEEAQAYIANDVKNGNFTILNQLKPSDSQYQTIVAGLPTVATATDENGWGGLTTNKSYNIGGVPYRIQSSEAKTYQTKEHGGDTVNVNVITFVDPSGNTITKNYRWENGVKEVGLSTLNGWYKQ